MAKVAPEAPVSRNNSSGLSMAGRGGDAADVARVTSLLDSSPNLQSSRGGGRWNGGVLPRRRSPVNEELDSQRLIAHQSAEYSGKRYDQVIKRGQF